MAKVNLKLLIFCIVAGCVLTAGPVFGRVLFNIDVFEDWEKALGPPPEPEQSYVRPLLPDEWDEYMQLWHEPGNIIEGEPYPETTFLAPVLEVYPGGGSWEEGNYPEEAGLVMYWGPPPEAQEEGDYASAWAYEYGADPDLSRSLIKVQVYAPQLSPFGLPGQITQISLAIQDQNYQRQAWYWNVGHGKTIQWNTWTPVTVNPSIAGVNATTPKADSFAGSRAFDVKKVTIMIFDENGRWVPGSINVPPPGQTAPWHLWNYWNYLMVVPNPNPTTQPPQPVPHSMGKHHIKWSQPPEVIDRNIPLRILGWDERSDYKNSPIMADDWLCKDDRPVTDIHWWGSFLGWNQPYPPPILPQAFHIGIWTNVKASADTDFSHPGTLLWENFCDNWVWNFFGYDKHPDQSDPEFYTESCFQFNQLLSEDEWFYQEPEEPNTIYWLSIAAIYDQNKPDPNYPWGWKTRPHFFEDDAVRTWVALNPDGTLWPQDLKIGANWQDGEPVFWPDRDHSWDLAFELTTIMPDPDPNDDKPPGPGPIDWDIPPSGAAPTVITMTAKTLTDESGVEYYFDELTGNPGGDDSGWQDSSGYTDSGLDPNTAYAYQVKARDKSPNKNETGWSPPGTATTPLPTLVDYNADKLVNAKDLAFFANKWLTSGP